MFMVSGGRFVDEVSEGAGRLELRALTAWGKNC